VAAAPHCGDSRGNYSVLHPLASSPVSRARTSPNAHSPGRQAKTQSQEIVRV
jgi:hypothetical protein